MKQPTHYRYRGPVMVFDSCVCQNGEADTYATSERKAKSNLAYRYKKEHNMMASAKVTLPERMMKV